MPYKVGLSEHPDCGKKRIAQRIWEGHCTRKRLGLPVFTQHTMMHQGLDGLSPDEYWLHPSCFVTHKIFRCLYILFHLYIFISISVNSEKFI